MRRRFMTCRYSYNLDNYVNFTMLEDGIVLFRSKVFTDLQVSINGDAWESDLEPVSVKKGDILALKSYGYSGAESIVGHIGLPACNLGGNIMSLIYGDEAKDHSHELSVGQFQYLFKHTSIVNVEVDFLPATTLADSCYAHMFDGCTRLVNVPELPATTLADSCYAHMFDGCTSLTQAPALPATTLASYCYYHMFDGCTKLNYIKMLATDITDTLCLYGWVYGVSSTGTFVKSKDATWDTTPGALGTSGVPAGWTVVNDGEGNGSEWAYEKHFVFEMEYDEHEGWTYIESGDFSEIFLFTKRMVETIGTKNPEGWWAIYSLDYPPEEFNITYNGEKVIQVNFTTGDTVEMLTESYYVELNETGLCIYE